MSTPQPVDYRATHPYKVGAAKTVVDSLLDGTYGHLPDTAMARLVQLRDVLHHENTDEDAPRCSAYGFPRGRCTLPAGHWPAQPHRLDTDVDAGLPRLRTVCEPTPNGAAIRERIR